LAILVGSSLAMFKFYRLYSDLESIWMSEHCKMSPSPSLIMPLYLYQTR